MNGSAGGTLVQRLYLRKRKSSALHVCWSASILDLYSMGYGETTSWGVYPK